MHSTLHLPLLLTVFRAPRDSVNFRLLNIKSGEETRNHTKLKVLGYDSH
jgi:hypothetical protein